ncbi:MAG: hypothetical protein H0X30_33330 [Anaerolineae bacterium]|nr:hypothetical protein [Anaerolineae bacterium]
MKSNLDVGLLENCAQIAKDIRNWLEKKDHPEHYKDVKDLELTRGFIHTLDLLETVLVRFEITAFIARQIFQAELSVTEDSLMVEFVQIDVEGHFSFNLLELCYELSNACQEIEKFERNDNTFSIFAKSPPKLGTIRLARHKATHFEPEQFEKLAIAKQYSILRRPYKVINGKLEKQLAGDTMPRVVELIKESVAESYRYLTLLREATIG